MRAAAVLRNAAKGAATPKPMSAEPTLYHLAPTGFWKKFRDAVVVNPLISSGLPLQDRNRYPPPASRPERYATPATAASDVAFNQYYNRDVRRAYPRTSVVTQAELSALLIAAPALQAVSEGAEGVDTASSHTVLVTAANAPALTAVIEQLPTGRSFVGGGLETASREGLPPTPPGSLPGGAKWVPKRGTDIPVNPDTYFPIEGFN
ncbi:uncharacterized protein CcaverHIS019_0204430 [Cutaneotrichosporon cavernicola]|uniref:21 kDa subunit of NADH dehydrogenase n=1 Tax=Cutaneotrichosporon cavernicola TaxID=279322 RepID=A0AA48I0X2_9TREE|nr:uncharacterized protein CcaverHIS019_0204430 [Cutaneotrichosporon cavernicola]BEI89081.1 hypothetical protein CcaverHIS019_0204430 [Cutaneotrichosporon cavernicola]BEI96857.1 hypothetical protein CcaverHIS631_0204460 [Cutaneotrichosporon cavernicola]